MASSGEDQQSKEWSKRSKSDEGAPDNNSNVGHEDIGHLGTTPTTEGQDTPPELIDELLDTYAPGRHMVVGEMTVPEGESNVDENGTPLVNWRGTTYPMGGLTVLQQVTYLHQLHESDPHPNEEQKAYMECVTKHAGQVILKCEGRTMTNIGLYGSDAKKIAELRQRGIIPCIHKSWNDTMADIGNKFWARIDWYIIRLREGKEPDRTVAERQLITATDNIEQEERTRLDQKKH